MKIQNVKSFLRQHRKGAIIVSCSLLVLALAGLYALWSVNTWGQYKITSEKWQASLQKNVDSALTLPATNHEERSRKMTKFQGISNEIVSAKKSLCTIPGVFEWQLIISSLKTEKESCDERLKIADTFSVEIQKTISYLASEQLLTKNLVAVTSQDKMTEASWDSQPATWQTAVDTIKKMSVESSFTPIKSTAVETTQSIQSAWQILIAAHKAKDKTKYLDAQTKLSEAYAALPAVATKSIQQFNVLATALQAAYQKAFKTTTFS